MSSGPGFSISPSRDATIASIRLPLEHVVHELDRALLSDRQRRERLGERNAVAQRQDRQHRRACVGRHGDLLRPLAGGGDLDHSPASSIGTVAAASLALEQRHLHHQDAVLVAGLGLLGHHVGAQLDAAPERPVLDLDLLEQPAPGLLRAPLARDQQLAPADLQRHVLDQHAGQVGLDHRPRRVVL